MPRLLHAVEWPAVRRVARRFDSSIKSLNNGGMPLQRAAVASAKAEMFKALGHPIRIRALEVLVAGERLVGELADELGVEMSHLSQQLAVLRRAQIVTARRVRSTVFYSVRDPR